MTIPNFLKIYSNQNLKINAFYCIFKWNGLILVGLECDGFDKLRILPRTLTPNIPLWLYLRIELSQ